MSVVPVPWLALQSCGRQGYQFMAALPDAVPSSQTRLSLAAQHVRSLPCNVPALKLCPGSV